MQGLDAPPEEIVDEEGGFDDAIKQRIVAAQERVSDSRLVAKRDAKIDPDVSLTPFQELRIYATAVEEYLLLLEPLLRSDELPQAQYYYCDVELGAVTLVPPDTDGYQFSLISHADQPDSRLRRLLGLPRGVELPEPRHMEFTGLKSVIEADDILEYRWEVCVDNRGPPPEYEYVYPHTRVPVPESVYINAVRAAGMFLDSAGIGIETDVAGEEMIREFDMSGEEPSAEYSVGTYTTDPDL